MFLGLHHLLHTAILAVGFGLVGIALFLVAFVYLGERARHHHGH